MGVKKEVIDNCGEITDVWEGPWAAEMKKIMRGKMRGSTAQSVHDAFIEQRKRNPRMQKVNNNNNNNTAAEVQMLDID